MGHRASWPLVGCASHVATDRFCSHLEESKKCGSSCGISQGRAYSGRKHPALRVLGGKLSLSREEWLDTERGIS